MTDIIIPELPASYVVDAVSAPHGRERAALIEEAWSWIGTPWAHQNRAKGAGVDCGNFVAGVFTEAGLIEAPETYVYPHDFYLHSDRELFRDVLAGFCDKVGDRKECPAALPGDILAYALGKLSVSHLAIVIRWPIVVHALRHPAGAVIPDETHRGPLGRALASVWRLKRWCDVVR